MVLVPYELLHLFIWLIEEKLEVFANMSGILQKLWKSESMQKNSFTFEYHHQISCEVYCEFVELLVSINCTIYPNYKVGSKNCISNIAGKCFVFHEKALFLRGLFPSQKLTKMFRLVILSFSWKIKLGGKWKNG